MTILNAKLENVGNSGIFPRWIYIDTDDTVEAVTTSGYLNGLSDQNLSLSEKDMALVTTKTSKGAKDAQVSIFEVSKSGSIWSLVKPAESSNSYQQFLGLQDIILQGGGSWLTVREARGDYVSRKTPADDTTVIGIDVTPAVTTAINKGFKIKSFDVIYSVGVADLDAHSAILDRVEYANNQAVNVVSVPLTGSLQTAVQANPYVTTLSVTTPVFNNTADSKYVIELTVDAALTSEYDYYGVVINFDTNTL